MRLDSSGNLLVGTTDTTLYNNTTGNGFMVFGSGGVHVAKESSGATDPALLLNNTGDDGQVIRIAKDGVTVGSIGVDSGDNLYIGGSAASHGGLYFGTRVAAPIDAGTLTDAVMDLGTAGYRFKDLYLSGGVIAGSAVSNYKNTFAFDGTSINGIAVNNTAGSGVPAHIAFFQNGTSVGSITCTASTTAYNTSSDYRLKENVVEMSGATERLKQLAPKRFNFIADADVTVDGFLAHEVQSVVPEAITGAKDAMRNEEYEVIPAVLDDNGNVVTEAVMGTRSVSDYQGIDQSKLVPLLVATVQELEARIAALESN